MTIVEMLKKNARLQAEKTAIIYKNSRISYVEFHEKSNALANFLIDAGLKKGEMIGLLLKKTPEAIISFLGVATAGATVFPIDYNQPFVDIQYILDLTGPSALIVSEDFQAMLPRLDVPCSDEKIIVVGNKTKDSYHTWDDITSHGNFNPPDISVRDEDMVYLNFTSGTTGRPKGAITTHANIYWNTISAVDSFKLTSEDIHLSLFPVFGHPHELFARPLYLGGTSVLIDNISPKTIARAISEHKITCMMAVGSIYQSLVRFHESQPFDSSSLRIPETGGMHINPTLAKRFEEQFKQPLLPVWGSTETTGIVIANHIDCELKPGSMGKLCPHYEVKIVGENREELPPDSLGEMAVKGPAVVSGYFGNHEETEKQMKDGWFFTADLVKRDTEGYFYFSGRRSGMMKVAGLKVFPSEIEDVLSAHPNISEVAVVKILDSLHGEVPKAVIVPKNGKALNKNDIRTFCTEKISRYKIPKIIEFVSELPKTPGGKILYRNL